MKFSIKTRGEVFNAEARTHEAALVKYLTSRRRPFLRVRDGGGVEELFSELLRKVVVSGGGSSKSNRLRWEKVGRSKFQGSRYVFSVEETGLSRLVRALRSSPR